jgi:hypothetical protein
MALFKRDGVDGTNHTPKRFVTVYGTAAITVGMAVVVDYSNTDYGMGNAVKKSALNDDPLACGVADETTSAAGPIRIQVSGLRTDCTARTGAINVGESVGSAGTTGGDEGGVKAVGTCAATIQPFAVCVDAFTDDNANGQILIIDKGFWPA